MGRQRCKDRRRIGGKRKQVVLSGLHVGFLNLEQRVVDEFERHAGFARSVVETIIRAALAGGRIPGGARAFGLRPTSGQIW